MTSLFLKRVFYNNEILNIYLDMRSSNLINKFNLKNKFIKSVSILASGTVGSQFITILVSPILTRLYTPEDFGLLAILHSILAVLGVIVVLRYELAIPLQSNLNESYQLATSCVLVVILMTIISSFILYVFFNELLTIKIDNNLFNVTWLIIIALLTIGFYKILNYLAIKKKDFKLISHIQLIQTLVSNSIQVFGFKLGFITLIIAPIIGQFIGLFGFLKKLKKKMNLQSYQNTKCIYC